MNQKIQTLVELQDTLRAIAEAQRQEGEVPQRLQALDRELEAAARELNSAREQVAGDQKERRRLEMDVGSVEALISRHQDQILGVKSNEAYRALQHEIDQERAKIRGFEDQILEIMERTETLGGRIRALEKEHAAERVRVEEEKRRSQERGAAAARERERLTAARAGLEQRLPADTVETFHRIARQRGGVGIVRALNEMCGGCNVRLRPQVYQEMRRGDETLFTCDSCKRFLYVADEKRADGQAPGGKQEGSAPEGNVTGGGAEEGRAAGG